MARVLLVEDDNNLREIYEARLQAEGYEISSAQDGEQALVVAKDFKPDLIISDVMMPKISGFEMLDILRNTAGLEHTRVIMLTALGQAEDKERADGLGADRYLVKSQVTLEDIIKAAHDILDGDNAAPAAVAAAVASNDPVATTSEPIGVAAAPAETQAPTEPTPETPAADTNETATSDVPVTEAPEAAPTPETSAEPVAPEAAPESLVTATGTSEPVAEPVVASEPAVGPEPSPEVTPTAEPAPEPTPVETPAEEVATPDTISTPPSDDAAGTTDDSSTSDAADADNQLLADAANSLGASDDATDDSEAGDTSEEEESTGSSKRVIQPIGSEPKPSLAELLALEESKGGVTSPSAGGTPVVDGSAAPAAETITPTASDAPETPPTSGVISPTVSSPDAAPAAPEAPEAPAAEPESTEEKKDDGPNPHDISL